MNKNLTEDHKWKIYIPFWKNFSKQKNIKIYTSSFLKHLVNIIFINKYSVLKLNKQKVVTLSS